MKKQDDFLLDIDQLFHRLNTHKACPMCGAVISAVKLKETKTLIHASREHWCAWVNGTCTVTATFKKKKPKRKIVKK